MAKKQYQAFKDLLRGAICNRTQAQFAQESGVSAEHLSRMLNQPEIHRPNQGTLAKIAAAAKNAVTLQDLEDALDQEDGVDASSHPSPRRRMAAVQDFAPGFHERAEETMTALANILSGTQFPFLADSVQDCVDRAISEIPEHVPSHAQPLPVAWEMGKARPNFGRYDPTAKFWQPVWLSMSDGKEAATSEMIAHFDELPCGDGRTRYVMKGLTCAIKASEDQYGTSNANMARAEKMFDGEIPYPEGLGRPEPDPENPALSEDQFREAACMAICSELPYGIDFHPVNRFHEKWRPRGKTPEERVLSSIFGEHVRWQETVPGFGFDVDMTNPPEKLAEFLRAHKKHVLDAYEPDGSNDEPGKYDELEGLLSDEALDGRAIADALGKFGYQDPDMLDDEGWPSAVATVMRAETGFRFCYHASCLGDENAWKYAELSEKGCIMIADADACGIQREAVVMATSRYVRGIGLKYFGDMLFSGIHDEFRKPIRYAVKDHAPDEDSAGLQDAEAELRDFDRESSAPAASGMYLAELKDGRLVELLWLAEHRLWLRARKDWTGMVARFCPDPVPPESGTGPDGDGNEEDGRPKGNGPGGGKTGAEDPGAAPGNADES